MEKREPLSHYQLRYVLVDGSRHMEAWKMKPLRYIHIDCRPLSPSGVRFFRGETAFCIPWHQVNSAELIETVIWDREEL
jgi:hypothetical protein